MASIFWPLPSGERQDRRNVLTAVDILLMLTVVVRQIFTNRFWKMATFAINICGIPFHDVSGTFKVKTNQRKTRGGWGCSTASKYTTQESVKQLEKSTSCMHFMTSPELHFSLKKNEKERKKRREK